MIITKQELKNKIFQGNNFLVYFILFILNVLVFFAIWKESESLILAIVLSLVLVIFIIIGCIISHKAEKKFSFSYLYIVEDVFINISVKKLWNPKHFHYDRFYTVKFSKNGIYKFQSYGKLVPDETDTDYVTATYAKPGDKYYIAILENKGKRRIIDCFNKNFFTISSDDFELVDGKYICK